MINLAKAAEKTIESYRNNKVIMNFVKNEALETVAKEINEKVNGSTTAKGVELLAMRHRNIKSRVDRYINAGLVGCYMASQGA